MKPAPFEVTATAVHLYVERQLKRFTLSSDTLVLLVPEGVDLSSNIDVVEQVPTRGHRSFPVPPRRFKMSFRSSTNRYSYNAYSGPVGEYVRKNPPTTHKVIVEVRPTRLGEMPPHLHFLAEVPNPKAKEDEDAPATIWALFTEASASEPKLERARAKEAKKAKAFRRLPSRFDRV